MALDDSVRAVVQEHGYGDAVVYLYGSHARGEARPQSDVDLALLAAAPIDALELQELREALAVSLSRDVDLVDLLRAPTVLQKEIVTQGRVLSEPHPVRRAAFEAFVLGRYARLNEERREILDRVAREGTVLGPGP